MHGVEFLTPQAGIALAVGLAIFIIVYRWIFRKGPGR